MAAVALDVDKFREAYPEFKGVTDGQLSILFDLSGMAFDNSNFSLEPDLAKRERLLLLLMAHLAFLQYGNNSGDGGNGGGVVGRVTAASQGSTAISFDAGAGLSADYTWYMQSQYGLLFWQLTKAYRMFAYFPAQNRSCLCGR
jgi:hypothetical protein